MQRLHPSIPPPWLRTAALICGLLLCAAGAPLAAVDHDYDGWDREYVYNEVTGEYEWQWDYRSPDQTSVWDDEIGWDGDTVWNDDYDYDYRYEDDGWYDYDNDYYATDWWGYDYDYEYDYDSDNDGEGQWDWHGWDDHGEEGFWDW